MINEKICSEKDYINYNAVEQIINAANCYVIPGLTDIHFHGCMGADCCDGTTEAFRTISEYQLRHGITGITPATMTVSEETLTSICKAASCFTHKDGADFFGLYMEGPFISPEKKGAQNEAYIKKPDTLLLKECQIQAGGKIKTVVVAPEMDGALEFIQENADQFRISIAHTNADYSCTCQALSLGACSLTHLYNAMPPLTHRSPGPIGAAADHDSCMVELICDGIHIHPSVVRNTFRIFGAERIIMISDSMRATGMPDGTYDLGGQSVHVTGNRAVLSDGTIAGSVTNLMDCMKTAILQMDIPIEKAVQCAAVNPIRALGLEQEYGSLSSGKIANIVLLDKSLNVIQVIHHGKPVY